MAGEHCKKYISYFVPYLAKGREASFVEGAEAGDLLPLKILRFLERSGVWALEIRRKDGSVLSMENFLENPELDSFEKVFLAGEDGDTYAELSALAMLRAAATSILLAEALDYVSCLGKTTGLDSKYLDTLCSGLEDLVRLNDDIYLQEKGTAALPQPAAQNPGVGPSTVRRNAWISMHCKQSSASEFSFMSFLLDIGAEEIFCFLAAEVVKCNNLEGEAKSIAAIRLSIRFLLMGAEVAMEFKTRGKRPAEEHKRVLDFCAECLVLSGQSVGSLCSKYPAIEMESWLIAAEDFCEACAFETANVHVSLFCGMMNALEAYTSEESMPAACKRALLMLLRLIGPPEENQHRYRKSSRLRLLQSPEQLASQLIGSARGKISLRGASESARVLFVRPFTFRNEAHTDGAFSVGILPSRPSLEHILNVCGRFLQRRAGSSEDSSFALLKLLATVMETAASRAKDLDAPPAQSGQGSTTEQDKLLGNLFTEPSDTGTNGQSSAESQLKSARLVHLEVVNLSIQALTVLIDFIPRRGGSSLYTFYTSTMRTARLLPLETLHSSTSSVLSSRLRSLLLSAPRGLNDADVTTRCHASVIAAFVEDGAGGLKDPLGARHESFFVAYFVLKSEREARISAIPGAVFVGDFLMESLRGMEEAIKGARKTTTTYATLLLIAFAYSGLQSADQRECFLTEVSAVVERAVKILQQGKTQQQELCTVLTLLNVVDYCLHCFTEDSVPAFLEGEIESEVFRSSTRGTDGSSRFQQLMTAQDRAEAGPTSLSHVGPTSSCLEALLDTLCGDVWDMPVGEPHDRREAGRLPEFADVSWRILMQLAPQGSSTVRGGVSARLNSLRNGKMSVTAKGLAELAEENLGGTITHKDCVWVTACSLCLLKNGSTDDGPTSAEAIVQIVSVIARVLDEYPKMLSASSFQAEKMQRLKRVPILESCLLTLDNCSKRDDHTPLLFTALTLMEAAIAMSCRVDNYEDIVWRSASLAGRLPFESELYRLLFQLAKSAVGEDNEHFDSSAISTVFHAHKLSLMVRESEYPSSMENFVTVLEEGGGPPDQEGLGARAAALAFGRAGDESILRLVPESSLVRAFSNVIKHADDALAARMLAAFVDLVAASASDGWSLSLRRALAEIVAEEAMFMRIFSALLSNTKAASSVVALFEQLATLTESDVQRVFQFSLGLVTDPQASSVRFLHGLDLILVMAAQKARAADAKLLVSVYFEVLQKLWDEGNLEPRVLEADLKSCVLVERIRHLGLALDLGSDTAGALSSSDQWVSRTSAATSVNSAEVELRSQASGSRPDESLEIEPGSMDEQSSGEEEEDDETSPKALASKCCTFTETGRQFVEQHWYYCYTCGMTWGEGICRICALICHRDHEVSYSRLSRFFCDCGAGASDANMSRRSGSSSGRCMALQPRTVAGDTGRAAASPCSGCTNHEVKDSDAGRARIERSLADCSTVWSNDEATSRRIAALVRNLNSSSDAKSALVEIVQSAENTQAMFVAARGALGFGEGRLFAANVVDLKLHNFSRGPIEQRGDMLAVRSSMRPGLLPTRKTAESSETDLLPPCLMTYCGNGAVAVLDPGGKLYIVDLSTLLVGAQSKIEHSTALRVVSQRGVAPGARQVLCNPDNPALLLVAYPTRVIVVQTTKQFGVQGSPIPLPFRLGDEDFGRGAGDQMIRASFVSGTRCLICASEGKVFNVYDARTSLHVPVRTVLLDSPDEDYILDSKCWQLSAEDADTLDDNGSDRLLAVCITSLGRLYSREIDMVDETTDGLVFGEVLDIAQSTGNAPRTLAYSKWLNAALVSLENGALMLSHFRSDDVNKLQGCTTFEGVFSESRRPAISESLDGPDFFLCSSIGRSGFQQTKALRFINGTLHATNVVDVFPSNSAKVTAGCFVEASGRGEPERPSAVVLLEDGSLSLCDLQSEKGLPLPARPRHSDSSEESSGKKPVGLAPTTVGFFEKCRQISDQITLGGDILNCDGGISQEEARLNVWGPGADCVLSPVAGAPFKIKISTRNRTLVITGIRILLGSCERSRTRVPAQINVVGRCATTLSQGARRWVDIPLGVLESDASPRDVLLELIPRSDRVSDGLCAFDALDVYGVSVSEFSHMRSVFEKKVARMNRRQAARQKQAAQRLQVEHRVRNAQLQRFGEPEETIANAAFQIVPPNAQPVSQLLTFAVEIEQQANDAARAKRLCRLTLEAHFQDREELASALKMKTLERLHSQAVRIVRQHIFAPVEVENILQKVGELASESCEEFEKFLRARNIISFCTALYKLHRTVEHLRKRVLHRGKKVTVSLLNILFAAFAMLESDEEKEGVARLVFSLLTHDDSDIRRVSSERLLEIISLAINKREESPGLEEMTQLVTRQLMAVLGDERASARKGFRVFELLNLLYHVVVDPEAGNEVIKCLPDEEGMKQCLARQLDSGDVWSGQPRARFEELFVLLRLLSVTATSESVDESLRRDLCWHQELFEGMADLLERLRPGIERAFTQHGSMDTTDNDDFQHLLRASEKLATDTALEPLLPRDIVENVLASGQEFSEDSAAFAVLTVDSGLQLLQGLWPIRGKINSECVSRLRRTSCVYAHLFKQHAQGSTTFWSSMLKSTSRLAKNLLHLLCDSNRNRYYSELDQFFYWQRLRSVRDILAKSRDTDQEVGYEEQVGMADALQAMISLATKRPRNWREFCNGFAAEGESYLDTLLTVATTFDDPLLLYAMKLLAGAVACSNEDATRVLREKSDSRDEEPRAGEQAAPLSGPIDLGAWRDDGNRRLHKLLRDYCVGNASTEVRGAASEIIRSLFLTSKDADPKLHADLQRLILMFIPSMMSRGRFCNELATLVSCCVMKSDSASSFAEEASTAILKIFRQTLGFLSTHRNAHIYNALNDVLNLEEFYLESELCAFCASAVEDKSYKMTKLENVRAETKYSDRAIICRLVSQQSISAVSLKIVHTGRSCRVRTINIWYSCRNVDEVAELKSSAHPWIMSKSITLGLRQAEARVTFPVPIAASNLLFEFAEFHSTDGDGSALNERLSCPRCSRTVSDRHGICRNCHENAYQCRQCRNINYENLDAFMCNECGYCKHGKFEFSLECSSSFQAERITDEHDRLRTVAMIEKEINSVHKQYEHLQALRDTLRKFICNALEDSRSIELSPEVATPAESERLGIEETDLESPLATLLSRLARAEVDDEGAAAFLDRSVAASASGSSGNRRNALPAGSPSGNRRGAAATAVAVHPKVNHRTTVMASVYGRDCATVFNALCRSIQWLAAMRKELLRYTTGRKERRPFESQQIDDSPRCFGCSRSFVVRCVELLNDLIDGVENGVEIFGQASLDLTLLENSEVLGLCGASTTGCRKIITQIAGSSESSVTAIFERLSTKLRFCTGVLKAVDIGEILGNDVHVLERICSLDLHLWESKLKSELLSSFMLAGDAKSASLAEHAVLPFLRVLNEVGRCANGGGSLQRIVGESDFVPWCIRMIIYSPSAEVRRETANILDQLYREEQGHDVRLLVRLCGEPLGETSSVGENSAEFFDLVEELIRKTEGGSRLVRQTLVSNISSRIATEADLLQKAEARFDRFYFAQGFVLSRLTGLLKMTLQPLSAQSGKLGKPSELIFSVLKAYLLVRGLVVQRTKLTDECAAALLELLKVIDTLAGEQQVLRVIIDEAVMTERHGDVRSLAILFEELCDTLCPERPEPVYEMVFVKASTQEEFIRGNLSRNTYLSSTVGKVMRDVKNKICRDLDLTGLLEDDFGLELLVAGNLLTLDLNIRSVYEHVWRPSQINSSTDQGDAGPAAEPSQMVGPMTVTYRLSGLDGEATEPIIDNLAEPVDEKLDPEVEFASTRIFAESNGLQLLLRVLSQVKHWNARDAAVTGPALKLLAACCQVRSNRLVLAKQEILSNLLECSAAAFSAQSEASANAAEVLLSSSASILAEYDHREVSGSPGDPEKGQLLHEEDVLSLLKIFLQNLDESSSRAEEALLRVLPFICRGVQNARAELIEYFTSRLSFAKVDASDRMQKTLIRLSKLLDAARSAQDERLRLALLGRGLGSQAKSYLSDHFPLPKASHGVVWEGSLRLTGPVVVLHVLIGLIRTAADCSNEYRTRIVECILPLLELLTTLEGVTSASAIGAVAEELLEVAMVHSEVETRVKRLRKEIRESRKAAAAARRKAILREAGVVSFGESTGVSAQPQLSAASVPQCIQMEGIVDETGPTCVVCREGFQSRPDEMLGLYVFNKRVPASAILRNEEETASESSVATCSSDVLQPGYMYATVTHFNAIHFTCHREAVRVDQSMRQRRDEWEGATVRNSQTKCNNLFPIKPPVLVEGVVDNVQTNVKRAVNRSYSEAVDQYFLRMHALGGSSLSQLQIVIHDLGACIGRFAQHDAAAFSRETRGGGPTSNAYLVPYFMELAMHLGSIHGDEKTALVENLSSSFAQSTEGVTFNLALSLCFQSRLEFEGMMRLFLGRARNEKGEVAALNLIAFTLSAHALLKPEDESWSEQFERNLVSVDYLTTEVRKLIAFYEQHDRIEDKATFLEAVEGCYSDQTRTSAVKHELESLF